MAFVSNLPIAAGPIFDALEEQVKTNEEALQTLKVLEKNFSGEFAVFRGVCDQLFIKIAKEHPESKKFVSLYKDYTDQIFELSNFANEDDREKVHETFEKISKLGLKKDDTEKELLDKMFLATKGMMFKARTPEEREKYYKELFVPTVLDLLKYLDKNGLNPKLHKEIRKLLVSSNFQKYLGIFVAFLFMIASGGFFVPLVASKKKPIELGAWPQMSKLILGALVLMQGVSMLVYAATGATVAQVQDRVPGAVLIIGIAGGFHMIISALGSAK